MLTLPRPAAAGWPALEKWRDLGWWEAQFGHRSVPLEVGSHTDGSWHEKVVSVSEFVASLRTGTEVVYCAQHTLFTHLPALCDDFDVPECVKGRVTRVNAWLGSSGTRTPLHFDSYDGAWVQRAKSATRKPACIDVARRACPRALPQAC